MTEQTAKENINRLKIRVIIILLCIMIPCLGLITFTTYKGQERIIKKENMDLMKMMVEGRHIIVENFLDARMGMLKLFSNPHELLESKTPELLDDHLNTWERSFEGTKSLTISDGSGTLLGSTELGIGDSVIKEEWFITAKKRGEYIGPLFMGENNRPEITFAVYTKFEEHEWVTMMKVGMEVLYESLAETKVGKLGGTFMVSPYDGYILSPTYLGETPLKDKNNEYNLGKKHYHTDYEYHGVEEVEASEYTRPDGRKVLEAHCCIRSGNWLMVVEQDLNEALGDFHKAWKSIFLTMVISMVVLIAGVVITINLVIK